MTRVELEALLERIGMGEHDAWDALLGALRARMLSLLGRRGVDPDCSEDIVQESLALVWQRWGTLRDPSRFWSWASSITLNRLRSTLQRVRAVEEFPQDVAGGAGDPGARLLKEEARQWIDARLAALRPEHRRAVRMRLAESLPPETVALRMGVTRARLRRLLHQGTKNFRAASWQEGLIWARALGVAG